MKIAHLIVIVSLFLVTTTSHAALIDFETTPAGVTPTDDGVLSSLTPYTLGGVQVAFGFDANSDGIVDVADLDLDGIPDGYARFEQAGTFPGETDAGFSGSDGVDTADVGFAGQLGNWFLRSPVPGSDFGQFIITYVSSSAPVTAASGEIWDIDGVTQMGIGLTEEYTVRAYDSVGNLLATQVSPLGTLPTPVAPLDGRPWQFSFSGLTAGIDHIIIDFTGTKPMGIGLAFNNFYPTSVPEPGCLVLVAVCSLMFISTRRVR
jgi:hypothetical protein